MVDDDSTSAIYDMAQEWNAIQTEISNALSSASRSLDVHSALTPADEATLLRHIIARLDVLQYYVIDCHMTMVAIAFFASFALFAMCCCGPRRIATREAEHVQVAESVAIDKV